MFFFTDIIIKTGYIFIPLFFLGLLGWFYILEFCYLYFNNNNLKATRKIIQQEYSLWIEKLKSTTSQAVSSEAKTRFKKKVIDNFFNPYKNNLKTVKIIFLVAPLLGFLGTVNGMITTFHLISLYGNGNPIFIAEGISEALLTTQAGITIAFPLLLAYNFCNNFIYKNFRKKLLD